MAERLFALAFTYLLGYALLWFGWACRRERLTVDQIARRIVLFGVGTIVALLAAEFVTALIVPPYLWTDCLGGGAWVFPSTPATCGFGISPFPSGSIEVTFW